MLLITRWSHKILNITDYNNNMYKYTEITMIQFSKLPV